MSTERYKTAQMHLRLLTIEEQRIKQRTDMTDSQKKNRLMTIGEAVGHWHLVSMHNKPKQ